MRHLARTLGFTLPLLICRVVLAQEAPRAHDPIAAEALFDEGREAMKKGNFEVACGKFEASQKLDPAVGTLMNLANCWEKAGKTASAWLRFRDAASAARSAGQPEREKEARDRANAVEARLAKLTLQASASMPVVRDGMPVDSAMFGVALPVDPGPHVVAIVSQGKELWRTTVDVPAASAKVVDVPTVRLPDPPIVAKEPDTPASRNPIVDHSRGDTQRWLGLGIGIVGLVSVGVGTGFMFSAQSAYNEGKDLCSLNATPPSCPPETTGHVNDANDRMGVARIAFIAGGALVVVGAVVWLTAPHGSDAKSDGARVAVIPSWQSIQLVGQFD